MAVPNIFANVTTSIPLSQLDQNFATAITLGNTAVYLGNTTTTLGNLTLTNVTLSSGTSNLASTSISNGTSNVSIASSGGNITIGTNGSTAVFVDTSQNVGISSAPSAWSGFKVLEIGSQSSLWSIGSGNGTSYYSNNLYYNGSARIYKTTGGASEYTQSSGSHQWYYAASGTAGNPVSLSEAMRTNANGQFFVGTTSAISSGFMCVQSPSASYNGLTVEVPNVGVYPLICSNTSNSGDNPFVAFQSDSGHTLRGQIYYNRTGGITVYATSSDQRLKENIANSGSGLEKLANIKIRSFDWKENGIHTDFGVVAQELYEVAPEAVGVGTDKEDGSMDRPWNVGTAVLVPAMIKAIQELKALNDTQAETINELISTTTNQAETITALTARIVALESK
jgi:hypothetical protein